MVRCISSRISAVGEPPELLRAGGSALTATVEMVESLGADQHIHLRRPDLAIALRRRLIQREHMTQALHRPPHQPRKPAIPAPHKAWLAAIHHHGRHAEKAEPERFVGVGTQAPRLAALGAQPWESFEGQGSEAVLSSVANKAVGGTWAGTLIAVGAIISIFSVVLVTLYGQTRILFAMGRDGLLPKAFTRVNPRTQTPVFNTVIVCVIIAIPAAFVSLGQLAEATSIGTLGAFAVVNIGVIVLRRKRPDLQRGFTTPLFPLMPILGLILIVALLIIPAVTARFWTERSSRLTWIAGSIGAAAAYMGAAISASAPALPTGPIIVLIAAALFTLSLFFAPARGVVASHWRRRSAAAGDAGPWQSMQYRDRNCRIAASGSEECTAEYWADARTTVIARRPANK